MADKTDSDAAGQSSAEADPPVVKPVLISASPAVLSSRRLRGPLIVLAILFGLFVGIGTFLSAMVKGTAT